jgi:hypothetical protein
MIAYSPPSRRLSACQASRDPLLPQVLAMLKIWVVVLGTQKHIGGPRASDIKKKQKNKMVRES